MTQSESHASLNSNFASSVSMKPCNNLSERDAVSVKANQIRKSVEEQQASSVDKQDKDPPPLEDTTVSDEAVYSLVQQVDFLKMLKPLLNII